MHLVGYLYEDYHVAWSIEQNLEELGIDGRNRYE